MPPDYKIDNGTNFSSGLFQKLLEYMHICSVFAAPYHPSANGTIKRVNQTLANILNKISNTHVSKWPLFLSVSIFAYNISTHLSTGYTLFEMLNARKPVLPPVLYLSVKNQKAVSPGLYLLRLITALIKLHTNAYVSAESRQINSHTALSLVLNLIMSFLLMTRFFISLSHLALNYLSLILSGVGRLQ